MSKYSNDYGWIGWVVAIALSVFFVIYIFTPKSEDYTSNSSEAIPATLEPSSKPVVEIEPSQDTSSWNCVDATSYNQNAYDDNRCTNGEETRYVSDSQAIELDPSYSPGKAGASYYNNQ